MTHHEFSQGESTSGTTIGAVIALLERRRLYHLALSLATQLLLSGRPMSLTWDDD